MGQHGLVSGADGKLLSLHEALKVELERQVAQLKGTLHKLEQLNLTSGKHGGPSEASHQRLLQVGGVCALVLCCLSCLCWCCLCGVVFVVCVLQVGGGLCAGVVYVFVCCRLV